MRVAVAQVGHVDLEECLVDKVALLVLGDLDDTDNAFFIIEPHTEESTRCASVAVLGDDGHEIVGRDPALTSTRCTQNGHRSHRPRPHRLAGRTQRFRAATGRITDF